MYRKNLVFAAACLGMLLFGIVFLSLGSASNMLAQRFNLDNRAIGTLTALLPFGILVGSLVFGPIVDRCGYRWMLVAASLIVGAALEGMTFAGSETLVQVWVFAIGFGGGVLNGATNALAADVSEGERGAKLSLLGVFYGLGALTMPSAIAALSNQFEMHQIVAGIGALAIVPAVYCLAIEFPRPKQHAERLSLWKVFGLLRDGVLLCACLAMAFQSGMEGMSNDWMTRYLKNAPLDGPISERNAQLGLVALTGAMMATRFALAGLLKRIGSRIVLLASGCTTLLGALTMMMATSYPIAMLGAAMIGAGLAAVFPIVLGYVGDRYPQHSGTAFSTIFMIAVAGNMAINKSFGYLADKYGVQQYPKVLIVLLASGAALLVMAVRQINFQPTSDNS